MQNLSVPQLLRMAQQCEQKVVQNRKHILSKQHQLFKNKISFLQNLLLKRQIQIFKLIQSSKMKELKQKIFRVLISNMLQSKLDKSRKSSIISRIKSQWLNVLKQSIQYKAQQQSNFLYSPTFKGRYQRQQCSLAIQVQNSSTNHNVLSQVNQISQTVTFNKRHFQLMRQQPIQINQLKKKCIDGHNQQQRDLSLNQKQINQHIKMSQRKEKDQLKINMHQQFTANIQSLSKNSKDSASSHQGRKGVRQYLVCVNEFQNKYYRSKLETVRQKKLQIKQVDITKASLGLQSFSPQNNRYQKGRLKSKSPLAHFR